MAGTSGAKKGRTPRKKSSKSRRGPAAGGNNGAGKSRQVAASKPRKASTGASRGGTQKSTASRSRKSSSRRKPARKSSSRSRRSLKPQFNFNLNIHQKALMIGISLIFLTAILVLSLISPNQGELTAALADLMWRTFGWGGLVVPLLMGGSGLYLLLWGMEQPPSLPLPRLTGLGLLFLVFEAFASLIATGGEATAPAVWDVAAAGNGGGYLGGLLAQLSVRAVDTFGAILLFVILGLVGTVLIMGLSRTDITTFVNNLMHRPETAPPIATNRARPTRGGAAGTNGGVMQPELPLASGQRRPAAVPSAGAAAPVADAAPEAAASAKTESTPTRSRRRQPAAEPPRVEPVPVILGQANMPTGTWTLPEIGDILESGGEQDVSDIALREQVEIIEHTLESFGAPATVVEINQGPTVTQFGVEPMFLETRGGKRTKVKVGKIASLADDLALALAAHSVRIQAPVPGRGYVGIEVPNPSKALVSLRDVMEAPEFGRVNSSLAIGLGQNVAGLPLATDLTKMPHLLIAGTTGSGKSVCVNGLIACLLLKNTPDDLKFVMVDPKRVELTGYNGIPHLIAPVVVDMERVIGTLQWAMREMDNRYKLFADAGTRNILEYNKKMKRRDQQKLPYIVIVIDELADLMMLSPEETEKGITRLAQMARATGIHMVIATQRPSVDVVTGLIKANFPARIAFAVASTTDSRVILDSTGAERLLGQGDMLFQSPDAAAPVRIQGCFVSEKELGDLIEYWQQARRFNAAARRPAVAAPAGADDQTDAGADLPAAATTGADGALANTTPAAANAPTDNDILAAPAEPIRQQPLWEDLIAEAGDGPQFEDELTEEAIALVRRIKKASTSLLQRRFRIGYTRAARLMDVMEENNIIGPPTGTSKAREVLPWDQSEEFSDGIISADENEANN